MVSSKSRSVSPGKPTMMSEVSERSRFASFVHWMRSRYQSRVYSRCMARRNVRTAGLDGEMDVVAEGGRRVHDVDDVLGEVARVRGGEADALDAVDFAHAGEELGEAAFAAGVMVAVDVLAEELDFGVTELRDALGFGEDAALRCGCAPCRGCRERRSSCRTCRSLR